jgi:hypothetical protein
MKIAVRWTIALVLATFTLVLAPRVAVAASQPECTVAPNLPGKRDRDRDTPFSVPFPVPAKLSHHALSCPSCPSM